MNYLYKLFILLLFFVLYCEATSFTPNPDAGKVSVSVDEESLQNLLSVYENTGFHDFGTMEKINDVDVIKRIDRYYFYNWKIDLSDDYLKFSMDGLLEASAKKVVGFIPFYPYVKTKGLSANASAFFHNFEISDDDQIHLGLCIANADVDISDVSYGYGYILDKFIIDGVVGVNDVTNSNAQIAVDNAVKGMAGASHCINVTDGIMVGYPEFSKGHL